MSALERNKTTGLLSTITNQLVDTEQRWFAIYTKYKAEKYVVDRLRKKGITAYVPLNRKVKKYDRKVKESFIPLINCYVFVKIYKAEYVRVLETEHVSSFVKQRKDLLAIPNSEISILKRIVGEISSVEMSNENIEPGITVEIIAGNLTGIKGTVVQKNGNKQFIVELDTLGYQLSMDIDESLLRRIR